MPFNGNANLPITKSEAANCRLEDVKAAYYALSEAQRSQYRTEAGGKAITYAQPDNPPNPAYCITLQAPGAEFGSWWDPAREALRQSDAQLSFPVTIQSGQTDESLVSVTIEGEVFKITAKVHATQVHRLINLLKLYKEFIDEN